MRCPYYASCKDLERGFKCQCPVACPKTRLAVCGTNGKTYANECELQKQSCWERKWIYVKSLGSCSKFVMHLLNRCCLDDETRRDFGNTVATVVLIEASVQRN